MRKAKEFTITELLIAIATVGMLSAVLFPAFISAKERAAEATCATNLKQIGMAFQMYSQDYDGCIAKSLNGRTWNRVLLESSYVSDVQTFFCPTVPPGNKSVPALDKPWKRSDGKESPYYLYTYGVLYVNDKYVKKLPGNKPGRSTILMEYKKVNNPANYIIVSESSNQGKLPAYRFAKNTTEWSQIDLSRHNGIVHSLFVDGHVEACNKARLSASNLSKAGVCVWDGSEISKL